VYRQLARVSYDTKEREKEREREVVMHLILGGQLLQELTAVTTGRRCDEQFHNLVLLLDSDALQSRI
jgi:hypothetical protein